MAATSSISGLASGIDSATIISQLMQIEAQGQTSLKNKLTTAQSSLKTLQDLNSAFSSLATSAGDLAKSSAWNPVSITSSSTDVVATAGSAGVTGSLSFTVNNTARSHQLSFATTAALTDPAATGSTVKLTFSDGSTQNVSVGDGSLGSVIAGLNASGTGVKASTVKLDDGSYRLQVTAATSGAAKSFTLTNADGSDLLGGSTVVAAGRDASITIGSDTVHSATNTFAGVANGLTITLKNTVTPGSVVTLDTAQDVDGMTAKIKALVDAANGALGKIDTATAFNSATKTGGALSGDAGVREVRNAVLNSVYPTDGTSMAGVGIQLDRFGKLTFDEKKFKEAYAADPTAVAAKFVSSGTGVPTDGFAARLQKAAKAASDPVSGTLTASVNGSNSRISDLQDRIADWDTRLELRQSTLQRQFTALETALQQMNSQSSWLSAQVKSLSNSNAN